MAEHSGSRSFVQGFVLLTVLAVLQVTGEEMCDLSKCRGPLRYYKGLGCKPMYKNPGDCCPESFNCDHLKTLSKDKCYANGHEYSVGEKLRDEDKNPCAFECTCMPYDGSVVSFFCPRLDCVLMLEPNCYYQRSFDRCCPGPYVCLKEGEERPTCEVDGKIYKDGEFFQPKSDPELECYCKPGYRGENVEPFCKKPNPKNCSPLFHAASNIHKKCAPVFLNNQNPQKDCNTLFRCQDANDTVIYNHDDGKSLSNEEENNVCLFGNMKMHVGDELNPTMVDMLTCVKCVCEVPPIPTCQELPNSKCGVSMDFAISY